MAKFEKFGEFDTVEEINQTAEGLKEEGDIENLKAMAAENGIDEFTVNDYLDGFSEQLVTALDAALAKLDIEGKEDSALYENQELVSDWIGQIKLGIMESEEFARAVRRKGKSLSACIGSILKWSFSHQVEVHKDLLKAAGVNAGKVTMGVPGMRTAKELIRLYYLGR